MEWRGRGGGSCGACGWRGSGFSNFRRKWPAGLFATDRSAGSFQCGSQGRAVQVDPMLIRA